MLFAFSVLFLDFQHLLLINIGYIQNFCCFKSCLTLPHAIFFSSANFLVDIDAEGCTSNSALVG